jgi:hypothetical protein
MKCEEFEAIGPERNGLPLSELDSALREAAIQHAARCSGCAALQESWQEARVALQALRDSTQHEEAPRRVELHLRHEFGMRHRTARLRAGAIFAAWTLATAAVVLAGVSWWNWKIAQSGQTGITAGKTVAPNAAIPTAAPTDTSDDSTLVADNDDFTLLPGSFPQDVNDSSIVRVGMQRGALSALGLPVNEETLNDWIQVDLLVGQDGLPKAVRLPQSE